MSSLDAARHSAQPLRLSTGDLDAARASLWDQGVPLAHGTSEPGEVGNARRSLCISDPDGHRIELVGTPGPSEPGTS